MKMKKILYTIAICLLVANTFAQKNFNTISFTRFLTRTGNPSALDQGVFAKKGAYDNLKVDRTDKTGTININANELTITVKTDGEADKIFKIHTINKEEKNEYKAKITRISCEDKMGVQHDLIITRDQNAKEINQMIVKIIQANNDGYEYTCTYLKNLIE